MVRKGSGRKMKGGGKSSTNKDHRGLGLKRRANKNRWDDICAKQLEPQHYETVLRDKTKLDPDLPGLGQHYCVACAKYCISADALKQHLATPKHRRRLKMLTTEKPYSHEEANASAGRGSNDGGSASRRPCALAMETA